MIMTALLSSAAGAVGAALLAVLAAFLNRSKTKVDASAVSVSTAMALVAELRSEMQELRAALEVKERKLSETLEALAGAQAQASEMQEWKRRAETAERGLERLNAYVTRVEMELNGR